MPRREQSQSAQQQRISLLTPGQQVWLSLIGAAFTLLIIWHLALALTTDLPYLSLGLTLAALTRLSPMSGLPTRYEPDTPILTVVVFGVMVLVALAVVVGLVMWLADRRTRKRTGMATKDQVRQSAGEIAARKSAAYTRKASVDAGILNVQTAPLTEVGFLLGTKEDDDEPVVLTNEDQVAVMASTGAGKTLRLMVAASIDAPGPVVVTSTKPEVLDAIVEARAGKGRIWVFDPLDRANWPEPMVWDPVAGAGMSEVATGRGESFAAGFGADGQDDSNPFFQTASGLILARLLHAAALSGGTIEDVISWALDLERSTAPVDILNSHKDAEIFWARTLADAASGADETVASVRMTLVQKVNPLLSRKVLRQLLPRPGIESFDPIAFVKSRDTLVLITDDQARSNVAPLTTMLLNEVIDAMKFVAARSMSGILDPHLRIVGDELANVAPLPKFPNMLADFRGYGGQWIVVFQSYAQMVARWGKEGADQILSNLNCGMVMGGLQDVDGLDRFSKLAGKTEITQVSANLGADRNINSNNISTIERDLMSSSQIRQIPRGKALVIYRDQPPMVLNLIPWTERPDADAISAGIQHIRSIRTQDRA